MSGWRLRYARFFPVEETAPRELGWQANSAKLWELFDFPGMAETALADSQLQVEGEETFVMLRLARVGKHVFALSRDAAGQWKLHRQAAVPWTGVVQVKLQATASGATALQSVATPRTTSAAHIEWVHFDRVSPARENNAATGDQDAPWLNILGHLLNRK